MYCDVTYIWWKILTITKVHRVTSQFDDVAMTLLLQCDVVRYTCGRPGDSIHQSLTPTKVYGAPSGLAPLVPYYQSH